MNLRRLAPMLLLLSCLVITACTGETDPDTQPAKLLPLNLHIQPTSLELPAGTQSQLVVTSEYRYGTIEDLTDSVTWSSSNTSVAEVSESGKVHAIAPGAATIEAEDADTGLNTQIEVTVTAAQLVGLDVTAAMSALPIGKTLALHATGHYTDGTTADLTEQAQWSSSDATIATISNSGIVSAVALGQTSLTASHSGAQSSISLQVVDAVITSLSLQLTSPIVAYGGQTQLRAIGAYSDGLERDITDWVTWSSSNSAMLLVSNTSPTKGLATAGYADASATVQASYAGYSASQVLQIVCWDTTTEPGPFAGGNGTAAAPYRICTIPQLDAVRGSLGSSYVLSKDIDLAGVAFAPIGRTSSTQVAPFTGTFDGNGRTISNLKILMDPTEAYAGFIALLHGNLKRVKFSAAEIQAGMHVGIAAAVMMTTQGATQAALLEDVHATLSKVGRKAQNPSNVGGLVGSAFRGVLKRVSYQGTVDGGDRVGGIVGWFTGGSAAEDCYSMANVSAYVRAGGLFATADTIQGDLPTVDRCYFAGTTQSDANRQGPIYAEQNGPASFFPVSDSYFDREVYGTFNATWGITKSTAQMQQQATFVGWDFAATWTIDEGADYPRLRSEL